MSPEAIARTIGAGSVFAVRRWVRFATSFCSWYASCSSLACQKLRRICVISSYDESSPKTLKIACFTSSVMISNVRSVDNSSTYITKDVVIEMIMSSSPVNAATFHGIPGMQIVYIAMSSSATSCVSRSPM